MINIDLLRGLNQRLLSPLVALINASSLFVEVIVVAAQELLRLWRLEVISSSVDERRSYWVYELEVGVVHVERGLEPSGTRLQTRDCAIYESSRRPVGGRLEVSLVLVL